jgi:hypothetical protein
VPVGNSESAIPIVGSGNPSGLTLDSSSAIMGSAPTSDSGLLDSSAATIGAVSGVTWDNGFTTLSAPLGSGASLTPALPQRSFPNGIDSAQSH